MNTLLASRPSAILLILLSYLLAITLAHPQAPAANGQSAVQPLIPNTLPACAQQCPVLQQGQTGCLPSGGAPVTSQSTYQSCFCQSALLTQLYQNTAVQLCSNCQAGDMQTIQNWYKGFCGKGGTSNSGSTTSAGGQQPTSTSTTSATATKGASTTNGNAGIPSNQPTGSWISTHWKWVLAIIIIFAGLAVIAVAGTILHRRYHARRQAGWATAASANSSAPAMMSAWAAPAGTHQSVHDLRFGQSIPPGMSQVPPATPPKDRGRTWTR